jgi:hypothetical protein
VRSVWIAVCMAAGLALGGALDAQAESRPIKSSTTNFSSPSRYSQASDRDAGKYERKCIILPCGTPWCYNTRVR